MATSTSDALAGVYQQLAHRRRADVRGLAEADREHLRDLGIRVGAADAVLDDDVRLLNPKAIRAALTADVLAWLRSLDVRPAIGSTNTTLLARPDGIAGRVLTAEVQTAGRGRRGRTWLSPFGRNLAVSIGAAIDRPVAELGSLSLVVGVAVRAALIAFGLRQIELKWPNDVLMEGRKLAGILIELADASRPAPVVIGIGVNVGCGPVVDGRVEQAVADVTEQVANPSRNELLAGIVNHVAAACERFGREGFAPFRADWEASDHFRDRDVVVTLPAAKPGAAIVGRSLGVGADGALRIETDDSVRQFVAGEVSLRDADGNRA